MNSARPSRQIIQRLCGIRNRFDTLDSREKLELLELLTDVVVRTSTELEKLHATLCFIRAFPDSIAHHRAATRHLHAFKNRIDALPASQRTRLQDSGIVGTAIHYVFSFEVAGWLAQHAVNAVSIDWDEIDDTARLDELLQQLLLSSEEDYFDSGVVSSEQWLEIAASGAGRTDFDWLLSQLREHHLQRVWSHLYNESELPLTWHLHDASLSKTNNTLPSRTIHERRGGMRTRVRNVKKEIMRPLAKFARLTPPSGARLINVAMTSLAVRHRETNHFNHANPNEVYVANVGAGIAVAVFGLSEKNRYPLECTMGYLLLSNGVPVGYGGGSALFRQVNTGINIFDEYRGSEAAFLWTQVMRVYYSLFGNTRFIVNAYQFGSENSEALKSGAFWFYYRLGYRPILPAIRKLAQRELRRLQKNHTHRSAHKTLRQLASCDMHLLLPGACASDLFDEQWLETSSMLATKELARAGGTTHHEASDRVAMQVALDLRTPAVNTWSAAEKRGLRQLAPFVAAARPASWPPAAKRSMRELLRSKGGPLEAGYAQLLGKHDQFLSALRRVCRRADCQ